MLRVCLECHRNNVRCNGNCVPTGAISAECDACHKHQELKSFILCGGMKAELGSSKVGSDGSTDSAHYGGADNPHETIKCLQAWGLEKDALLWTAGKYLSRAGKKNSETLLKDLKKARFYLDRRIQQLEG